MLGALVSSRSHSRCATTNRHFSRAEAPLRQLLCGKRENKDADKSCDDPGPSATCVADCLQINGADTLHACHLHHVTSQHTISEYVRFRPCTPCC